MMLDLDKLQLSTLHVHVPGLDSRTEVGSQGRDAEATKIQMLPSSHRTKRWPSFETFRAFCCSHVCGTVLHELCAAGGTR